MVSQIFLLYRCPRNCGCLSAGTASDPTIWTNKFLSYYKPCGKICSSSSTTKDSCCESMNFHLFDIFSFPLWNCRNFFWTQALLVCYLPTCLHLCKYFLHVFGILALCLLLSRRSLWPTSAFRWVLFHKGISPRYSLPWRCYSLAKDDRITQWGCPLKVCKHFYSEKLCVITVGMTRRDHVSFYRDRLNI